MDERLAEVFDFVGGTRFVEVRPYRNRNDQPLGGLMVVCEKDCPQSAGVSCESWSGNSICPCYDGIKELDGVTYVACTYHAVEIERPGQD